MHDEEDIGEKKVRASHAGGYDATEGVDLVAVADIDEGKLDRFGEAWEIPPDRRYVGHESMLAAEDLDLVSVCTPSYLHDDHVVDAAESQADSGLVWCEKPIASSVSDAGKNGYGLRRDGHGAAGQPLLSVHDEAPAAQGPHPD